MNLLRPCSGLRRTLRLALGVALSASTLSATAQQACDALAEAFDAALAEDPGYGEVLAARALAGAVAADADHWLATGMSVYGSWISDAPSDDVGLREYEAGLNLPLRLPGEHAALAHEASAAGLLATRTEHARRLAVAGTVRELFWAAAARNADVAAAEHELEHLGELDELTAARVERGEAAPLERDLTRMAAAGARAELEAARGEATAALRAWRHLTGCPGLPPTAPEAMPNGGEAAPMHPLRTLADARVAQARARQEVVRRRPAANPTLGLMVRRERGAALAPWIDAVGVNVTLPLGSSGNKLRAQGEAARDAELAAAQRAATLRSLASAEDAGRARQAAAESALQAALRRDEHARSALARARKAWLAGAWDTAELLRVAATAAEAQLAARRARVALGRSIARLNQAIGVLP